MSETVPVDQQAGAVTAPHREAGAHRRVWSVPGNPVVVLAAAVTMVLAHLVLRAWALFPSFFYTDDYRLLREARDEGLSPGYLLRPFDSQFMPVGRFVAWVVAESGNLNWPLAASITLAAQLIACLACLWMLITLFGIRPGILAPLALYLSTAITLPATSWWAAALNQVPLQAVVFVAVGAFVQHLRSHRKRWLVLTLGVLAIGLLCYVKTLVVGLLLAWVAVAYFTQGSARVRLRQLSRVWPAAVSGVVLAGAFVSFYLSQVPQVFASGDQRVTADVVAPLADTMIGTAVPTGLVGGPWTWDTRIAPVGLAAPPDFATHLSWVLLALTGATLALLRLRTGRAWGLLATHVLAAFVLALISRAPVAGSAVGLEYRYVSDVVPTAVLALGLATLRLPGAYGSSRRRPAPLLAVSRPRLVAALGGLVVLGGVVSQVTYAHIWHTNNPGERYMRAAREGLQGRGAVDLADQIVPDDVIAPFLAGTNTTEYLLPVVVDNVRFPSVTPRLVVLGPDGRPGRAIIDVTARGQAGPLNGCGWKVRRAPVTIPLTGDTFDYGWWVRVGYLASNDGTWEVEVGGRTRIVPLRRGLHSVFLEVTSGLTEVTVGGAPPGATVCVDTVEVGTPVPGGPL